MKNPKLLLGIVLFLIGLLGVLSMLTMDLVSATIPEEMLEMILEKVTIQQLKWALLINPTVLLILFTLLGTLFHDKVGLTVPSLKNMILQKPWTGIFSDQLKSGISGGLAAGVIMVIVAAIFSPHLPAEFMEAGEKLKPTLSARFLYGGLTEEIMMRYGLMTFIVWVAYQITQKFTSGIYWTGIILAALLFGAGHLPLAFSLSASPSAILILYIILGNAVGGMIFGWLYWKKGLEAAMIAHIFAHVAMLMGEQLFDI